VSPPSTTVSVVKEYVAVIFAFSASKSITSETEFVLGNATENILLVVPVSRLNGLTLSVKTLEGKLLTADESIGATAEGPYQTTLRKFTVVNEESVV
jgi:hypothetical protein